MSPLSVTFVTDMFPSLWLVLYTFLTMSLYMVLCFKVSFLIRGHKHTVLFLLKSLFPKLFHFLKVFKLILSFFVCLGQCISTLPFSLHNHFITFIGQSFLHWFVRLILTRQMCIVQGVCSEFSQFYQSLISSIPHFLDF